MKRWKRAIKQVVVFALLGMVMSYAVAWGMRVGAGDGDKYFGPSRTTLFVNAAGGKWAVYEWRWNLLSKACVFGYGSTDLDDKETESQVRSVFPWWLRDVLPTQTVRSFFDDVEMGSADCGVTICVYALGWPLRCVRIVTRERGWERTSSTRGGKERLWEGRLRIPWHSHWTLTRDSSLSARPTIDLPFQPVWPGLLLNSAFYGTILWLLWFTISRGPGMIRRGIRGGRRRLGLCVKCGYDLRGLVPESACPECGAT
jgi:hypothetical protein